MENKLILPDMYGVFEIKNYSKNRIRLEIAKLKNNRDEIENLKENLKKITAINSFKIIQSIGNITIEFDEKKIEPQLLVGIILKLLNLELEVFGKRKGKLKTLFNNLIDITDISLYNKSRGLLDTKTLAGFILLAYGIKKVKMTPALPAGATLIWWGYNLLTKKGSE